jgi:hypothetical protein
LKFSAQKKRKKEEEKKSEEARKTLLDKHNEIVQKEQGIILIIDLKKIKIIC